MRLPGWLNTILDWLHAVIKWRFFYTAVFLGCAFPAADLGWRIYQTVYQGHQEALGVNPVEAILKETGETALAMMLLSMTVTPLRRLFGWNRLQIVRRMLGIWSFFYALCHFTTYVVFDQLGDINAILDDVLNRKFIFVGMLAFSILCVLAATSFTAAIRMLGRNWGKLHKLVYVAAVAGVIHFIWGQKADYEEPIKWAVWLAVLLGIRLYFWNKKRQRPSPVARLRTVP